MKLNSSIKLLALLVPFTLAGCASTGMQMGSESAKTTATGSAGGATAEGANSTLERCARPVGTVAILEDTSESWFALFTREYKLHSTVPVLRLLAQQSNCFVVVERGRGMQMMDNERALRESGELRSQSRMGKGQMVAADYTLVPTVLISQDDAGGMHGAVGALVGGLLGGSRGSSVGATLGASMKTKEASTMLTLSENRTGIQMAVAEGSSSKMDMSLMGGIFGSSAGGGLGGYTNTAEGKVIAAAFTDAFNGIVRAVKGYKAQAAAGPNGHGSGGSMAIDGIEPDAGGGEAPPPQPTKRKRR